MAELQRASPGDPQQLSAATAIVLRLGGISLPRYDAHPEIPLEIATLDCLLALAGPDTQTTSEKVGVVSDRHGIDAAALSAFVLELENRHLLVASPSATIGPPRQVAVAPLFSGDLDSVTLSVIAPTVLAVTSEGFAWTGFNGELGGVFSAAEVVYLSQFVGARTRAMADEALASLPASDQLSSDAVDRLLGAQIGSGLVRLVDVAELESTEAQRTADIRKKMRTRQQLRRSIQQGMDAQSGEEASRRAQGEPSRIKVVPINTQPHVPPMGLAMVMAHAIGYQDGRLTDLFDFEPRWILEDAAELDALAPEPAVFLFSNYTWDHEEHLQLSRRVKELNPQNITIHGGPDTPKYPDDCAAHFARHPHIDVAVRGEGEETLAEALDALAASRRDGVMDLSVLEDVRGLTFRSGDRAVRTDDRDRIEALDDIPSPLLTGLLDAYANGGGGGLILETNRGCPYGCTFCDWGSATLSRIRKFDMDRVFAELEWGARAGFQTFAVADANFGIFARDVDIAEKIVELRETYGFPRTVATNYAKNTVKHLRHIIETFAKAGIVAEGLVALQSMDQDTLLTIRRKNIKVEKYNDLSVEFQQNGLALAVDIMLGLPGSTAESFRRDLQECVNRDVRIRIQQTVLLPNSPMNEPEYREEHRITAGWGEIVSESATFTRQEHDGMSDLAYAMMLLDTFGVLRFVARYLRQEAPVEEVEFYDTVVRKVLAEPARWPALEYTLRALPYLMVPVAGWEPFIEEVRALILDTYDVADDDALDTALAVQLALLPNRGRTFPVEIQLSHDYAAWNAAVRTAAGSGHLDDWTSVVAPLRDYPAAPYRIDDPADVCGTAMGETVYSLAMSFRSWELDSPASRAHLPPQEPMAF